MSDTESGLNADYGPSEDSTLTTALGLLVSFVRMNPGLDPTDPVILRTFRAYVEFAFDDCKAQIDGSDHAD